MLSAVLLVACLSSLQGGENAPPILPKLVKMPVVTENNWQATVKGLLELRFGTLEISDTKKATAVRVFLGYNEEELYALFICAEPERDRIKISHRDPVKDHDAPVYRDDCVELFLTTDPSDWNAYYEIVVNAAGVVLDAKCEGTVPTDMGWKAKAKTRIMWAKQKDCASWLAEVRIPFKSMGGVPKSGSYWAVNLTRIRNVDKSVDYSWAPITGSFHRPERFRAIFFNKAGAIPRSQEPVIARRQKLPNFAWDKWQQGVKGMTEVKFGAIEITEKTRVPAVKAYLGHDGNELYMLFVCTEPQPGRMRTRQADPERNHDGPLWGDDCVEMYLVSKPKEPRSYYQLIVNPKGVLFDGHHATPGKADKKWTSDAKVRTTILKPEKDQPGYWLAEVRVQLEKLGGLPEKNAHWRINLTRQRKVGRSSEYSWSPLTGSYHQPECYQPIRFE